MAKEKQLGYTHLINKSLLENNDGQLEGLPKNPRYIKDERFAKLKHSLEVSPEFLEANPLKVYPLDNGKLIILAGNMRFHAGCEIGITDFPCYIFRKETPIEKLKEFVIKDNIPFGSTDWDALANDDWNVDDLDDWGMDVSFLVSDDDLDMSEQEEPTELVGESKDKPLQIKLSFEEKSTYDTLKQKIEQMITDYDGIIMSVSGGEL